MSREYAKFPYGLSKGCKGKCAKNPCKNGGECMEGYDSFTCNCRWTPFKVNTGFTICLPEDDYTSYA